jgi:hypothetical protein
MREVLGNHGLAKPTATVQDDCRSQTVPQSAGRPWITLQRVSVGRRINTWITTAATLALKRQGARYGVTHREMLEKLILEANKVCRAIDDDDTVGWNR